MPGWCGLVATADAELASTLTTEYGRSKDRIQIVEWADGPAVMRQAAVIVNHGGANSTKEAIAAGCPIVTLPMRADQPGIAARVAFHGLGKIGNINDEFGLARLVQYVGCAPGIRQNIRIMSEIFQRYDREKVAENILESAAGAPKEDGMLELFKDAAKNS